MQTFEGLLEIDNKRGVIYFHTVNAEIPTLLRICSLGELKKFGTEICDITHMKGHNFLNANKLADEKPDLH